MKEFWNERFSSEEYIYGLEPNEYFKSKLDLLQPGTILLPAEGEGRNALYASKNQWIVNAFDYSEQARKKALELAKKHNVSIDYYISDLIDAEVEKNNYDAAAIVFLHFEPSDRKKVHSKIIDSVKNGGYIIAELFSKDQLEYGTGGPKNINMLYTVDEIKEDFASMDIMELEKKEIEFNEGEHHKGKASVIRLFAQKRM
jgi:SAM-dependent methyltransferase